MTELVETNQAVDDKPLQAANGNRFQDESGIRLYHKWANLMMEEVTTHEMSLFHYS